MSDRPAIPIEVKRDVLVGARHRCAVCCEPLPLELAHIVPWHQTHDHSAENLIALCSNCHSRADQEPWGPNILRRYKLHPCAQATNSLPPVSAEQQALIDLIISVEPDAMTELQRLRLVSVVAAYVGLSVDAVHVISITPTNSSRIRIQLPAAASARLSDGFRQGDPMLRLFFEEFPLLSVIEPNEEGIRRQSPPAGFVANTRVVGDVVVLDIAGRVTLGEGSAALRDILRELIAKGYKKILLDLDGVTYIDSSGIGELVSGFTAVSNSGGQLKLLNLKKGAESLLQITKLYTVFDDLVRAIHSFEVT